MWWEISIDQEQTEADHGRKVTAAETVAWWEGAVLKSSPYHEHRVIHGGDLWSRLTGAHYPNMAEKFVWTNEDEREIQNTRLKKSPVCRFNEGSHIGSLITSCSALWQDSALPSNSTVRSVKGVSQLNRKASYRQQAAVDDRRQHQRVLCALPSYNYCIMFVFTSQIILINQTTSLDDNQYKWFAIDNNGLIVFPLIHNNNLPVLLTEVL